MGTHVVECLRCGCQRLMRGHDAGECGRCRYLGWAPAADLSEHMRRALRDRPLELRRSPLTAA